MLGQIVTSIRVDEDLWREAKIYCIKNDLTLAEFVGDLLKERLKKESEEGLEP